MTFLARALPPTVLAIAALVTGCTTDTGSEANTPLDSLRVMRDEYPRAYFFRSSESEAANKAVSYEEWERNFERLMGIEGKVLDEAVPGRSERNLDFFTRFKTRHPEQLLLLHFNGNTRDPRYATKDFFAGHWLYFNGANILSDVPAEEGETEIWVDNATLFMVNVGQRRNANEDIGLCMLDEQGTPNWHESEQVQLVSVDESKGIIRVRRGCYGTKARAFPSGRAYAAAHAHRGPAGEQSHLRWYYNYSTRCPRDAKGRSCVDVLVEDVAARFLPGGDLAAFDGVQFDVLRHELPQWSGPRGADADADGKIDNGCFDGVSSYGIGVVEFCRRLRQRLGDSKLILADGQDPVNQRAFGILNGIESEGFPQLGDLEIHDWSGGLNRHWFWAQNSHPPVFNYINHRFTRFDRKTGRPDYRPTVSFETHRLVFAAAIFTDSAICYAYEPRPEPGELVGIWDELRMGVENKLGWLGKPLRSAVRLAEQQPDLLEGRGTPVRRELLRRFQSADARFALEDGVLKITAARPQLSELRFRLSGVPVDGPHLFVKVHARAEPMRAYPPEVARTMWVGVASSKQNRFMTWVNEADFGAGFYFSGLASPTVDLEFAVEGSEPVWISGLAAYAHPDAIYREFEHGVVLANPAPHPYDFDLAKLFPGARFRRLKGSARQDPVTNNGATVNGVITLRPKEGLFLGKEQEGNQLSAP